jgi:prophage regulatory protein
MRLLTFSQLKPEKGWPYCRDHTRRLVKAGEFPAPVPLSEKRVAWVEAEVDACLEQRVAQRDQKAD